ncbi:MAG: cupin domain-containing protein [Solirubrobacterales bacterium]
MQHWDVAGMDVEPSNPVVIDSQDEARAIAIQLPAGEKLSEHQVHERAWLVVVTGSIEVNEPGGKATPGGAGLMVEWDPNERHEVKAVEDSRLLLILAPWPGDGHPSNRG